MNLLRRSRGPSSEPVSDDIAKSEPFKVVRSVVSGLISVTDKIAIWLKKAGVSIRKSTRGVRRRFSNVVRGLFSRDLSATPSYDEDLSEDGVEGSPPESTGPPSLRERLTKTLSSLRSPFRDTDETAVERRERKRSEEVEEEKRLVKEKKQKKKKKTGFIGKLIGGLKGMLTPLIGGAMGLLTGSLKTLLGPVMKAVVPGIAGATGGLLKGTLKTAGRVALGVGGLGLRAGLGAAAFMVSNPVGWAMLGTTAIYAGYKIWSKLTENNIPKGIQGHLVNIRLLTYGVSQSVTEIYNKKLWNLEALLESMVKFKSDGSLYFQGWSDEKLAEAAQIMEVDFDDVNSVKIFQEWFNRRFSHAYVEFRKALYETNKNLQMKDVRKLTALEVKEFLKNYTIPTKAMSWQQGPFPPGYRTMSMKSEVDELVARVDEEMLDAQKKELSWLDRKGRRELELAKRAEERNKANLAGQKEDVNVRTFRDVDVFIPKATRLSDNYQELGKFLSEKPDGTSSMSPTQAIRQAVETVGDPNVNYSTLSTLAKLESGMDPYAAASTSSAKGMFQFIDDTWKQYNKRITAKYGVPENASPYNPYYAALAAAEYQKDIMRGLDEDKVRAAGISPELSGYLGHFLGIKGANNFLHKYNTLSGRTHMQKLVTSDQFKANPNIMNTSGDGFIKALQQRIDKASGTPDSTYATNVAKKSERRKEIVRKQMRNLVLEGREEGPEYRQLSRIVEQEDQIQDTEGDRRITRAESRLEEQRERFPNIPVTNFMDSVLPGADKDVLQASIDAIERRSKEEPTPIVDVTNLESYSDAQNRKTDEMIKILSNLLKVTVENIKTERMESSHRRREDELDAEYDRRQTSSIRETGNPSVFAGERTRSKANYNSLPVTNGTPDYLLVK